MNKVSDRVLSMQRSPIRNLIPFARKAEENGIHVLYGNIGQPDLPTPQSYKNAAIDYYVNNDRSRTVAYGPSEGLRELREAYVRFLGRQDIQITLDDVFITTAASEALLFTLLSVCDPGDEVIIPEPFYTNYRTFCMMAGVRIVPLTLSWEDGYAFPGRRVFEQLITSKTKAILLCSPNNPTGTTYNREQLNAILTLCREYDIYLIADEVYREFVYNCSPISVLQLPHAENNTIVIDSLSKRYSLCGARVGMVVCKNPVVLENILKMAQARLCPVTVEQLAAIPLLDSGDEEIIGMRELYRKRIDILCAGLNTIPGVDCQQPQGAFYVMARLPVSDAKEFARHMVSNIQVEGKTLLVAPAEGFYLTEGLGTNEVRIAAVMDEQMIHSAVSILAQALT